MALLGSSHDLFAGEAPSVIYGEDNRSEPFLYEDFRFKILARSVAVQIKPANLIEATEIDPPPVIADDIVPPAATIPFGQEKRDFYLDSEKLASRGICESERFANQPSAGRCSGFFVGKNLLVTAGHCIRNQSDCDNFLWAFGYTTNSNDLDGKNIKLKDSQIYQCKKIVARSKNRQFKDFAVIELDRAVTDRRPLKLNRSRRPIAIGEDVLVIGHPSGLPMKIADGAKVTELSDHIFYATLDTYGGNSGSPVFNQRTGEVEGILVIGNEDYILDPLSMSYTDQCVVSNRLPNYMRKSEGVSYISYVTPYVPE